MTLNFDNWVENLSKTDEEYDGEDDDDIENEYDDEGVNYDDDDLLTMSSSHSTFMSPAAKQYLLPGWSSCLGNYSKLYDIQDPKREV